jgi:outer membrane immunogenic protein
MKRLMLSSVALFGLTAAAVAADLPRRAAPPAFAPVYAPVFTWTGFYVGVNAGYGWGNDGGDDFGAFLDHRLQAPALGGGTVGIVPSGVAFHNNTFFGEGGGNRDGFLGGAQVGFNWQLTPGTGLVLGVEADIQWADFGGGNHHGFGHGFNSFGTAVAPVGWAPGFAGFGVAPVIGGAPGNVAFLNAGQGGIGGGRGDSDWFGTARVRVGWAFDRILVYATGGVAFTDSSNDRGFFGFGGGFANGASVPGPFYVSPAAAFAGAAVAPTGGGFVRRNNDDYGWALGGGVEWAFTNNLTFKLEGLWVNFDDNGHHGGCCFAGQVVGVTNTGAPVFATNTTTGFGGRDDADVFIARVGINYKFGL